MADQSTALNVLQGITLGIALLGAALGVINTWVRLREDRVRLRVSAAHSILGGPFGVSPWHLSIQVVNLSSFPVRVVEIGLEPGNTPKSKLTILSPMTADSGPWPRRLESREGVTIICPPDLLSNPELTHVKRAYVRTECGTMCRGSTPALRQYVSEVRNQKK